MKKLWIVLLVLLFACSACATEVKTPVPESAVLPSEQKALVYPESDNKNSWALDSRVEVNTDVFVLRAKVTDGLTSTTQTNAEGELFGYNTYVSGSYRQWEEGKGQLPVSIISIQPDFHGLGYGDDIVIKTSDKKIMSLPDGAVTTFICIEDVEVLSPVISNQKLTTEHLTFELDNCRMKLPTYELP